MPLILKITPQIPLSRYILIIAIIMISGNFSLHAQQTGKVLVVVDEAASVTIDGSDKAMLEAEVPHPFELEFGEHYILARSLVTGKEVNQILNVESEAQKVCKINLKVGNQKSSISNTKSTSSPRESNSSPRESKYSSKAITFQWDYLPHNPFGALNDALESPSYMNHSRYLFGLRWKKIDRTPRTGVAKGKQGGIGIGPVFSRTTVLTTEIGYCVQGYVESNIEYLDGLITYIPIGTKISALQIHYPDDNYPARLFAAGLGLHTGIEVNLNFGLSFRYTLGPDFYYSRIYWVNNASQWFNSFGGGSALFRTGLGISYDF